AQAQRELGSALQPMRPFAAGAQVPRDLERLLELHPGGRGLPETGVHHRQVGPAEGDGLPVPPCAKDRQRLPAEGAGFRQGPPARAPGTPATGQRRGPPPPPPLCPPAREGPAPPASPKDFAVS